MICPTCGKEATFTEHSDGIEDWLVCNDCGAKTDDKELAECNLQDGIPW